jgi:hypothetical protein
LVLVEIEVEQLRLERRGGIALQVGAERDERLGSGLVDRCEIFVRPMYALLAETPRIMKVFAHPHPRRGLHQALRRNPPHERLDASAAELLRDSYV